MRIVSLKNIDELDELKNDYDKIIMQFSANWCGPCKQITPIIQNYLKGIENDKVVYVYCNIDDFDNLSESFGVKSIPCFSVISNTKTNTGEIVCNNSQLGGGSSLVSLLIF